MTLEIAAIGSYLPERKRENSSWPSNVAEGWKEKNAEFLAKLSGNTPGEQAVVKALRESRSSDPFGGSAVRYVAEVDETSTDMETKAAQALLKTQAVDPQAIDAVVAHTHVPRAQLTNTACTVHAALKLRPSCLATSVESAQCSFAHQLTIASGLIASGMKNVLLTQSVQYSRLLDYDAPHSPWFGDGATAVLVRAAKEDAFFFQAHYTDGRMQNTLTGTVRDRAWYDDGPCSLEVSREQNTRNMFLGISDRACNVVDTVLASANVAPEEISFYACHQSTSWLRRVTQEQAQICNAKSVDTFSQTASLGAANLPFVLDAAMSDGLLTKNDLVLAYTGGTGITDCATLLRWAI